MRPPFTKPPIFSIVMLLIDRFPIFRFSARIAIDLAALSAVTFASYERLAEIMLTISSTRFTLGIAT